MSRSTPFRSMRSWLRHLSDTSRLAVFREQDSLEHELAAVSKHLDGTKPASNPGPAGARLRRKDQRDGPPTSFRLLMAQLRHQLADTRTRLSGAKQKRSAHGRAVRK